MYDQRDRFAEVTQQLLNLREARLRMSHNRPLPVAPKTTFRSLFFKGPNHSDVRRPLFMKAPPLVV